VEKKQSAVLTAALGYADLGWHVFPLHSVNSAGQCSCGIKNCPDAGKHPSTTSGLRDATRDKERITNWFKKGDRSIGVVTGQLSGITVIDIDIGPNKQGDDTWAKLNKDSGEPQTLMAQTGSGGVHAYFKYNSSINTSTNTLGPGVDTRNDKGYVVAPPSSHRSGNAYSWINELPVGDLPSHLTQKAKRKPGRPRKHDPTRRKYTLEEVQNMLQFVPADDRTLWRNVGIIMGREFGRADAAWEVYNEWADSWGGAKGRNHDEIMREAFYELSMDEGELSMGTLVYEALEGGWVPKTGQVPTDRFVYFAPGNNYIYIPTGSFWPAESVNSAAACQNVDGEIVNPTEWLKRNRTVTSMSSDPLIPDMLTANVDYRDGDFIENEGACLYNAYRPPSITRGDPRHAGPYIEHVRRLMPGPGDADQFLDYMAHRIQNPGEKPRFALLLGGEQGVGKDTAITMASAGIGVWNISSIEAAHLDSSFNEHAASVLVVVSEAANSADMSKWAFNERLKVLIAGQPDYLTINPKYGHKYSVRLHCGVIITTNHLSSGLYIPDDDRRYDVIDCATRREMCLMSLEQRRDYFDGLWRWYEEQNGAASVYAALLERDISKFSANSGQRSTAAHRELIQIGMTHDQWAADAIDLLKDESVLRTDNLWSAVQQVDPEMSRKKFNGCAQHALRRLGYVRLVNPAIRDGRWRLESDLGRMARVQVYYNPDKVQLKEAVEKISDLKQEF